jgi:hypothetical protein
MIIAISQHNPTLLGVRKKFFVENFFHPAYHTANYVKAYANVSLNFPDAPSGKPLPDIDLTLDSEDDEDDAAPVVFSSSGGGAAASASGHGSSASGDSRGGKRSGGAGKAAGGGVDSEDDADLYAPLFFSNSDSDGEEGGGAPAAASHVGGGGGFGGGGAAGAGGVYASQVSHLHPDLQKQEADRLLRAGLLEFGMRVVTCEADGNCLFRAVAHQMYASEAQHAQVRRQAVEYMREHEDRFVFLVDPPTSNEFRNYLAKREQPVVNGRGEWGDHAEIVVMEELFDRPIEIFSTQDGPSKPRKTHLDGELPAEMEHVTPIRIHYQGGNHYNSRAQNGPRRPRVRAAPAEATGGAAPVPGDDGQARRRRRRPWRQAWRRRRRQRRWWWPGRRREQHQVRPWSFQIQRQAHHSEYTRGRRRGVVVV